MSNRRYHMHVAYAADVPTELLDSLALFTEHRVFLSHDLITTAPISMQYSRRCIDECDYVLILIADSYGLPNNTGVSQLHLSYIYAKTKNKPMMVLVKSHENKEQLPRQLNDLINLIEQQVNHVYYYEDDSQFATVLAESYDKLRNSHTGIGWIHAKNNIETVINQSVLRSPLSSSKTKIIRQNQNTRLVLDTKANQDSIDTLLNASERELVLNSHKSSNVPIQSVPSQAIIDIQPDDTIQLKYTAHAYEESNLREISMTLWVSWRDIIQALMQIPSPFTNYGMQRCLNSIITRKADSDVKKRLPRVHAVTRCQILVSDMKVVQSHLKDAQCIQSVVDTQRQARELWRLTDRAEQMVKT